MMKPSDKASDGFRVGFIGCGGISVGHFNQVDSIPWANVAAVCDIDHDRAEEKAQEHSVPAYDSHEKMFDAEDLDAVVISTWIPARGKPEIAAASRSIPFFVEKPVAKDKETASQVLDAVRKSGVVTCVGYQLRYSGSARGLRNYLKSRAAGMVVGQYWCGGGRGGNWHVDEEKSGGQLLEQATHTIDLMRYLVGEIDEVFAMTAKAIIPNAKADDVHCLTFRFASGAIGSLSATWALVAGDWSQANIVDIFLDRQRIRLARNEIEIQSENDQAAPIEEEDDLSIMEVFLDGARKKDPSKILTPYEEGVKTQAVSLAAIASARSGRPEKVHDYHD